MSEYKHSELVNLKQRVCKKQGRIHGRTVADGWAGAVIAKTDRYSKMLWTDGWTD